MIRGIKGKRRENTETQITRDKIVKALKKLKDGKAVGGNGIPQEVWKYGVERNIRDVQ